MRGANRQRLTQSSRGPIQWVLLEIPGEVQLQRDGYSRHTLFWRWDPAYPISETYLGICSRPSSLQLAAATGALWVCNGPCEERLRKIRNGRSRMARCRSRPTWVELRSTHTTMGQTFSISASCHGQKATGPGPGRISHRGTRARYMACLLAP